VALLRSRRCANPAFSMQNPHSRPRGCQPFFNCLQSPGCSASPKYLRPRLSAWRFGNRWWQTARNCESSRNVSFTPVCVRRVIEESPSYPTSDTSYPHPIPIVAAFLLCLR
jgi:hypothetical protein